jgi:Flp pilus assembly pilin Flp
MGPELQMVKFLLAYAHARAVKNRLGRQQDEHGASAIEWAIISAIVVVAAVALGYVITTIVNNKGTQLQNCSNTTSGNC